MNQKISVSLRFSQPASFQTKRLPSRCSLFWSSLEWTPAKKTHLSRLLSFTPREKATSRSFSSSAMSVGFLRTTKISTVRLQSTTPFVRATSRRLSCLLTWGRHSITLIQRHKDQYIMRSSKTTMRWSSSSLIKEPTCRQQTRKA